VVYAVVKAGGKQHKVAVGDVVEVNRLEGDAGDAVSLPALLLVDGRSVISETSALAKIAVTGEIIGHHKGPKIKILKYKNKTGYRKRIGHRQLLTELLVTDIDDGKPKKKKKATAVATKDDDAPKAAAPTTMDPAARRAEKPSKTAQATPEKTTDKAAAKADADEKPSKTAKASKTTAKASEPAKPAKSATAKTTKTAKTSKASDTDEKED
jgi:large subunit ribosomal protein L21